MFTNTYLPHVGGVARSVDTLETGLRNAGHEVRVVAPEYDGAVESPDVLRVPAIQNFNGSDFSFRLPSPGLIRDFMDEFDPDIIHSHHPFLLGDAALREAWKRHVPLVFTHHTLYERYTHYVPLDSPAMKRMAIRLAVEYCDLAELVIAPSESIARLLHEREVRSPVEVIPTGIDVARFKGGDSETFRTCRGIAADARVVGHVGRLSAEKNLGFLSEAVSQILDRDPTAVFLLVGDGSMREEILSSLSRPGTEGRIIAPGKLAGAELADAYRAMDAFVFASLTETQGIVLAEAMAAGAPVCALDGPGVREIVRDGTNGFLLPTESASLDFATATLRLLDHPEREKLACAALETAESYSAGRCVERMADAYSRLLENRDKPERRDHSEWERIIASLKIEWDLLTARTSVAAAAIVETEEAEVKLD